MNKTLLAVAVSLALLSVGAQAAEPITNPEDRTTTPTKSASSASARQVQQAPRQIVEPTDRSKGVIQNSTSPKPSLAGRKQGDIAGSCIPMRTGQPGGSNALFDVFVPPKPQSKPGQKQGTSRSDCEPGTRPAASPATGQKPGTVAGNCVAEKPVAKPQSGPGVKQGTARSDCEPGIAPRADATRATPNGPHLAHRFPNGTRLYANVRDGVVRNFSAFDHRDSPLKVTVLRDPLQGLLGPNDAIERGRQRAEEQRKRQQAAIDGAIEQGADKKCIVKILEADGTILMWDMSNGGMGCPKGA